MATFIGSRIFARITVVYLCHFTSSIALCLRRAKRIKLKRSLISEVKCAMLYTFLTIYATRSWQCYILVMCDGTNFTQTYVSGEVWNGAIWPSRFGDDRWNSDVTLVGNALSMLWSDSVTYELRMNKVNDIFMLSVEFVRLWRHCDGSENSIGFRSIISLLKHLVCGLLQKPRLHLMARCTRHIPATIFLCTSKCVLNALL